MPDDPSTGNAGHREPADPRFGADGAASAFERLRGTSLDALFASLPASVWMTDAHLTLTFAQGPLVRELRVTPGKLIGRTLPELFGEGRDDHPFIQIHRTALGGHEASLRIEWGGNVYHARVAPLRDADGRVVGCAGVHQQIAWIPDPDGTLRESDVRLRRIVESNVIGIAFGNEQGQILDANDAFLQTAGYAREDLATDAMSWPALTPVESHQRQLQALAELATTGRCEPFEMELIRKDHRRVPVLVGAARLSVTRREGVAFVVDVSDRQRRERLLRGELGCADALLAREAVESTAARLLGHLRDDLGWRTAALWTTNEEGRLVLLAALGLDAAAMRPFRTLAMRTAAAGTSLASDAGKTFAAPLILDEACVGVLLVVGRDDDWWDAHLLDACERIAARVAGWIGRSSGGESGRT
jgi:PAS domain S-box-containing protein